VIKINSGVLSGLVILVLLILVASGWFTSSISKYSSNRKATLLLLVIFIGNFLNFPLQNGWVINVGGFVIPAVVILTILFKDSKERLHLLTAALLLGAVYFLAKELIRLDPILLLLKELYQMSGLLVLIATLVTPGLGRKIVLLVGGILLGELYFNLHHQESFYRIVLGDGETRDLIWFSLVQLGILHIFIRELKKWLKDRRKLKKINFTRIR